MSLPPEMNKLVEQVTKKLMDEGRIIEAGWQSLRLMVVPASAPEMQLIEMRKAFFAGAQHLFASIMSVMDDSREPTENDLRRVEQIHMELEGFGEELQREIRQHPR
jgi:hypothetical protein